MLRTSTCWLVVCASALPVVLVHGAEPGGPVYQRRSSVWQGEWYGGGGHQAYGRHSSGHSYHQPHTPNGQHHGRPSTGHQQQSTYQQHSSFSFQRPYPYHLDYYRMKYGGSYAPYFGNLYGPPKVYAPAYFGGQPYGPNDHGPPPPGEFYGPPAYGQAAPAYGQPMMVESVPAESAPPTANGNP